MRLTYLIIARIALIIFTYALMFFIVFYLVPNSAPVKSFSGPQKYKNLKIGSEEFELEFATSTMAQIRGLSGRASMPENQGMIFIFNKPGDYGFWMINMKFSLDMIWLNNKEVAHITKNVSPGSFPKIFHSSAPADVVIELNAGAADRVGLKVGDKLDF